MYYRFCEKLVILINAHHVGQYFRFHLRSGSKLWLPQSIQVSSAWYLSNMQVSRSSLTG